MTATTNKPRLVRRPVHETRALMLEAAIGLLLKSADDPSDAALASAVSNVRVADVVAEASVLAAASQGGRPEDYRPFTIGALYQIWPTQPEFQADLLLHLADLGSLMYPTADTTRAHVADGVVGEDLFHLTMREAWEHCRTDPVLRALLAAYPRIANERVRSAIADGYTRFVDGVFSGWSEILHHTGRRPLPPYDESHLARAVAAVFEGFTLQWLADPASVSNPSADGADLAITSAVAVVQSLTEPIPRGRNS